MTYNLKNCTTKQLPEILEIFNDAILNSTALYDYKVRNLDMIQDWYTDKLQHNYPVIGAFDTNDKLLGFATYGAFRIRPAYKYTVEHSVYIENKSRGKGIGRTLLHEITKLAEEQNYHVLIGVIDASNTASIVLHEKEGFIHSGTIKEVGYKFGKWLNAEIYQKILKTPQKPNEN